MLNFPYIFTFYSFKGGVGRSLALLNAAYTLAGRGRHVLVVDMDLEAPGISSFLLRHQELAAPTAAHPLDGLSLLSEAINAVKAGGQPKAVAKALPPISNYIRSVADEKLAPLRPKIGQIGRLDVVVADQERDYWRRWAEVGLQGLPQDQLIALSSVLHHYFKAQRFPHRPLGLEPFEAALPTPYDYVLVDSRTGITELGGLCVGPLADRLVVLTGLNDQNVQGTLSFMKEVGIVPQPRTKDATPWDEADVPSADQAEVLSLGPKPTLVVASPVPSGEIAFKQARRKALTETLGIQPILLSYHPQMALLESVFVRDYPEEYLAVEYAFLTDRIMAQVTDHPAQLTEMSRILWNEKKEPAGAITCVVRLSPHQPQLGVSLLTQLAGVLESQRAEDFWAERQLCAQLSQNAPTMGPVLVRWGNALSAQATTNQGDLTGLFFDAAYQKYAEALKLKPDFHEALNNWGNALMAQARTKHGASADRLLEVAGQRFAEALKIKPDKPGALTNWGNALSDQAQSRKGEAADRLVEAACRKFAEALRIKPDFHEALNNWGIALSEQAKTKKGGAADRLFEAAGQKFSEALTIKPDLHEALNNWGNALIAQARTKQGESADRLVEAACQKYAEALKIKSDHSGALYNWGNALSALAKTKRGDSADRLFEAVREKYAAALKIKPDYHEALRNWGIALSEQAITKQGEPADRLFEVAYQKFSEALKIKPDSHETFHNWAIALADQARTKQGELADRLFEAAYQRFSEALRIKPDEPEALRDWGVALSDNAKGKKGESADRLLETAYQKFADAIKLEPDSHEVLNSWGIALSCQAIAKQGEPADRLFEAACQKYAEALRIKPDKSGALNNWGNALFQQSRKQSGVQQHQLRQAAREKLLAAEGLLPGSGAYNLACVEASDGDAGKAIGWLKQLVAGGGQLNRKQPADDPDFEPIRHDPAFVEFLQSLPQT